MDHGLITDTNANMDLNRATNVREPHPAEVSDIAASCYRTATEDIEEWMAATDVRLSAMHLKDARHSLQMAAEAEGVAL